MVTFNDVDDMDDNWKMYLLVNVHMSARIGSSKFKRLFQAAVPSGIS